jgi:diaminopimelate epimerase
MNKSVLSVEKYVGTGNDFIIIDEGRKLPAAVAGLARSEIARRLCHRQLGAGADGLIFLLREKKDSFSWEFYNGDGSTAEMCGNATRCVGRWVLNNYDLSKFELLTAAGLVRIQSFEREVTSHLDYLRVGFKEIEAVIDGRRRGAVFVNTGVPHAVIEIDSVNRAGAAEMRDVIRAFRLHSDTGAAGTNVTFLQRDTSVVKGGELTLTTTTFERGVEGFTLSCGTGVLASAAVALRMAQVSSVDLSDVVCKVTTPGGELKVRYGAKWEGASLSGPAEFIYSAKVAVEIFCAN